jgi:hypothetical protein
VDSVIPLSTCLFSRSREMDEMNIGLYKLRKDQCDICFAYKTEQLDESDYQEHVKTKEAARSEKDVDKKKSRRKTTVLFHHGCSSREVMS